MQNLFVFIIKFYYNYISAYKLPSCRFYPSCSKYALIAIQRYGVFKGGLSSIARLLCCNPFYNGRRTTYDPIE